MKPNKRQKLCHNCEGEVDVDVIVCPFCAADLREDRPAESPRPALAPIAPREAERPSFDPKGAMQSLYPPPYSPRGGEEASVEPAQAALSPPEEKKAQVIGPTILFTLGVQLLLLGLLMLLFSHKGIVILKWEAKFWFLYAFASAPLLYFGYRSLSKL